MKRLLNNRRITALAAGGVAALMLGAAFASVPLYNLFCRVTGYGGTPAQADAAPQETAPQSGVGAKLMTVRFNADVAQGMPWIFQPEIRSVTVKVGEAKKILYRAFNPGATAVVGTATFNVTPAKAARYFSKIECFCFEEQRLDPGATAELPVSFFVDPAIAQDPAVAEVGTLTLSYTFFVKPTSPSENSGDTKTLSALAPKVLY